MPARAKQRRAPAAVVAALALAGCGSAPEPEGLPPAAEPAPSPPLTERPAGRVVSLGGRPRGLAFDRRTRLLAVGLAGPDQLALVDPRTGRVRRRVPLPGAPGQVAIARPGGPALVPVARANVLVEVALPRGRTRVTRVGRAPSAAAADPRGRVWVGNRADSSVSVIRRGRVLRTLPTPVGPGAVVSLGEAGRAVGVIGLREGALELFGTRSLRSLGQTIVGQGPTQALPYGPGAFAVADTRGGAVIFVRARPEPGVVFRKQVGGSPYGMARDRRRGRFYVTLTETNEVLEFTGREVNRSFPTVRQPDAAAVDPRTGRLFVAGRSDGTLQIIDPDGR